MCMMCMMMHAMDHTAHGTQTAPASESHAGREALSLLDILKRRYALGEINREQFEEMKRVLGVSASGSAEHANH